MLINPQITRTFPVAALPDFQINNLMIKSLHTGNTDPVFTGNGLVARTVVVLPKNFTL